MTWPVFPCNRWPGSHEISMFVFTNIPNNAEIPQSLAILTMRMIELCGISALSGIFLETSEHQNLLWLRRPIGYYRTNWTVSHLCLLILCWLRLIYFCNWFNIFYSVYCTVVNFWSGSKIYVCVFLRPASIFPKFKFKVLT